MYTLPNRNFGDFSLFDVDSTSKLPFRQVSLSANTIASDMDNGHLVSDDWPVSDTFTI
jgi:hypothetical protein